MTDFVGKTLLHYKVLARIGEGGMGVVYKALDTRLHRTVALKCIPNTVVPDELNRERFRREARAAASLNHSGICTIYAIEETVTDETNDPMEFIVMEYIEGVTLSKKIKEWYSGTKKADEKYRHEILTQIVDYTGQIAEALATAHDSDITHRDIKPDNIMITNGDKVKIMDFGLAKLRGSAAITKTGATSGTVAYMSPEQINGETVDYRSDIFSFGIVLYEMIAGRRPFIGEYEAAVMYQILNDNPEPLYKLIPDLPPTLQQIINRCLEKEPEDRYQATRDMLVDINRVDPAASAKLYASLKEMPVVNIAGKKVQPELPQPDKRKTPRGLTARRAAIITIPSALFLILLITFLIRSPVSPPEDHVPAGVSFSIAVLPFDNLSPDPDNEYFADGMTEDIITQLSKISTLSVISRTSVMQYKGTSKNIREIGRELGADIILEGSVRRDGNRLRIVGQLIDARSDRHLWAETYDRDVQDIFRIQSEVAQSIATALRTTLTPAERDLITREPTANFASYQLYLKGRDHFYRYTHDDNEIAIDYYKRALALDSTFALAYAGIADAYNQRNARFGYSYEVLDTSIQFSEKALTLDPQLAEAYKSLGQAYDLSHQYSKALQYYEKSMEINPNYWPAVSGFGAVNFNLGNLDIALLSAQKAVRLAPNIMFGSVRIGWIYQRLVCDSLALEWFYRAKAIEPDHPIIYTLLSEQYLYMGDLEKAREYYQEVLEKHPDWVFGYFAAGRTESAARNFTDAALYFKALHDIAYTEYEYYYGYALLQIGSEEEGKAILDRELHSYLEYLEATVDDSNLNEYALANIYAILGNRDEALKWLKIAIDKGWMDYRRLIIDPYFNDLRSDTSFRAYLDEMKIKVRHMRDSIRAQHPSLICEN